MFLFVFIQKKNLDVHIRVIEEAVEVEVGHAVEATREIPEAGKS
jgi:hypothetical protein